MGQFVADSLANNGRCREIRRGDERPRAIESETARERTDEAAAEIATPSRSAARLGPQEGAEAALVGAIGRVRAASEGPLTGRTPPSDGSYNADYTTSRERTA